MVRAHGVDAAHRIAATHRGAATHGIGTADEVAATQGIYSEIMFVDQ